MGLALYFGWPIIEAVLIILPIPDPKDISEKVKGWFNSIRASAKASPPAAKKGYTGNFNQVPETLGESDEEGDDIGRAPTVTQRKNKKSNSTTAGTSLSYGDSDDEEKDATQLISLDGASSSP